MKRFYKKAEVTKADDDSGYHIALDGRIVNTPQKNKLLIPTEGLARDICAEWNAQDENIDPQSMPFSGLMNTCIDHVGQENFRRQLEEETLRFIESDLICYYAQEPEGLVALQKKYWQPLQQWFEEKYGVTLKTSTGIHFVDQNLEVQKTAQNILTEMDDGLFTGFQSSVGVFGSFVIALAFVQGHIDYQSAFDSSVVDDLFQIEQWGRDDEKDKKWQKICQELRVIESFVSYFR